MKIKRTVLSLAALIILSLVLSACASVANASGSTNLSVDLTDFAFKPDYVQDSRRARKSRST